MAEKARLDGNFPFREIARRHLETADELLGGQGRQLIYACLELRLAIEAIAYDTLQAYEKNLSSEIADAYAHWQPSKILRKRCFPSTLTKRDRPFRKLPLRRWWQNAPEAVIALPICPLSVSFRKRRRKYA
ncbi:MAG: hypothetical protein J0G97_06625 [Rhizobium pusense]|nr:hypothetical protein [Agrobacterium pusense]